MHDVAARFRARIDDDSARAPLFHEMRWRHGRARLVRRRRGERGTRRTQPPRRHNGR